MYKRLWLPFVLIGAIASTSCSFYSPSKEYSYIKGPPNEEDYVVVRQNVGEYLNQFPVRVKTQHINTNFYESKKSTPQGSKELRLVYLTDPKSTPYEKMEAMIVVMVKETPIFDLKVTGFNDLDAEWIDEDLLKIDLWPGRCVELIELFDTRNGRVLYRSSTGIFQMPSS